MLLDWPARVTFTGLFLPEPEGVEQVSEVVGFPWQATLEQAAPLMVTSKS